MDIRLGLLRVGDVMIGAVNAEVFNPIAQRLRRESPFKADDDDADEWIGTIELHSGWRVLWQVHFEVLSSRLRPGCAETAIVNRTQWLLAL